MARNIFLLLITGLMGLFSSPQFLAATDVVDVTGIDKANIVETVPLPEPEPEPVVTTTAPARKVVSNTITPTAAPTPAAPAMPANSISIAGKTIEIVNVADTAVDAGNHVNKYGAKFLYGHNTGAVFGNLPSVGVGSVFTVSTDGVARNYQVAEVQIFEKVSDTKLSYNGVGYRMSAIVNGKGHYDMVLMTCYGTMLGGGDATHRYVVFANAI